MSRKIKVMDLFSGCGGLLEGFLKTNKYEHVAAVEWLKPQVDTLRNRLSTRWNLINSEESVLHFDIQREEELFKGWKDEVFGESIGLDNIVNRSNGIDIIIGGPPCQAYSVAGRVRDENGMNNDYRNYLFEHYLSVVNRYKPNLFIFENVPGMLSAMPDGTLITDLIRKGFSDIDYEIIDDIKKYALVDSSEFGVPQVRKRVIIVGIRKNLVSDTQLALKDYYKRILPSHKSNEMFTVENAIGDLPVCKPLFKPEERGARKSHEIPDCSISWHKPRYHSIRDMTIFEMLSRDIEKGNNRYTNSVALSNLYEEFVGSKSPIHRYHVLRREKPSTTIIAHLYKDGNRFIHYDSSQARTITPREAARLQSFDDNFDFLGSQGSVYQMIGNAVPPELGMRVAYALENFMLKYGI